MTKHAGTVYRIWSQETLCRKDPAGLIQTRTRLIDDMVDWLREHGQWNDACKQAAGQTCFEMARTLAREDLDAALDYARDRQARGCWLVTGAAAPWKYKLAYRILGMAGAEKLAQSMRAA